MTRAWIFSDLHLDQYGQWDDPFEFGEHPDHDVILCAGDMSNGNYDFVPWLLDEFSDDERSRFVYVPGNHDYWNIGMAAGTERLHRIAGETGITVLDDAVIEIAGIRIAGTTLWSDLARDPWLENAVGEFTFVEGFTADDWRERHEAAVDFLKSSVRPGDIVMTHFAPSMEGRQEEMKHNPREVWKSSAVATDLEDLITALRPSLCIHGHIHVTGRYEIGEVPVVTNAKGSGPEWFFMRDRVYDTDDHEPSPVAP